MTRARTIDPSAILWTAPGWGVPFGGGNGIERHVSIQILRGIAALMVVAFHITDTAIVQTANLLLIFHGGVAGVDIFFVISGFVMYLSTRRPGVTPVAFWRARMVRIVPLYYLSTLLFLLVVMVAGRLPASFSPIEILLSFLFVPFNNTLNGQPVPILGVGWTLNYEVIFYLVFGLALMLRNRLLQITAVTALFATLIGCRFVLSPTTAFAFRVTSPVYLEFLAGVLFAFWITRHRPAGCLLLGMLAIGVGFAAVIAVSVMWPTMPRTIGYGIPALVITAGFVLCEDIFRNAGFALLRYFGDASYSIYLIHGIVIYALTAFVPPDLVPGPLAPALTAVAAIGAGLLCYAFVEKPVTTAARRLANEMFAARAVATGREP